MSKRKMKIFDCFMFFNELELLELRLMELYNFVDHFVLVEANKTHTGKPKELLFEKNKHKYKKYLDKIIHVKVKNCPKYSPVDISRIENFQRNAIMRGLKGMATKGDKILISDLDEIPNTEVIKDCLKNYPDWIFFQEPLFYYYVNCQVNGSSGGTVMADYGSFKIPQRLRNWAIRRFGYFPPIHNIPKPPECRNIYFHGGWHYSYLTGGDPDKVIYKAQNIYESSRIIKRVGTNKDVAQKIATYKDPYGRGARSHRMKIVDISKTKPKSMDKFLKKYPQFFFKEK